MMLNICFDDIDPNGDIFDDMFSTHLEKKWVVFSKTLLKY